MDIFNNEDADPLISAIDDIRCSLTEASLYEQLAEECSELSQAALKKARKLRGENPTPKTTFEIDCNIIEEITDIRLCLLVLDLDVSAKLMAQKLVRWTKRLNNEL